MDKILIPSPKDVETARTIVSIWEAYGTRFQSGAPGLDGAFAALVEMVSRGQAVALEALPERLTLRQFAALIGTSDSYALWLVRAGHVPSEESNLGPTVALRDAVAFRDERNAKRRAALDDMAAEEATASVLDGIDWNDPPEHMTSEQFAEMQRVYPDGAAPGPSAG